MRKLFALLLVASILFSVPAASWTEDEDELAPYFHIAYAMYNGAELFGEVEIPDGSFYIRATFWLSCGRFFVLTFPVSREGLFSFYIAVDCEAISVVIVDSPSAIVPGSGTYYKTAPVMMI